MGWLSSKTQKFKRLREVVGWFFKPRIKTKDTRPLTNYEAKKVVDTFMSIYKMKPRTTIRAGAIKVLKHQPRSRIKTYSH